MKVASFDELRLNSLVARQYILLDVMIVLCTILKF
jgi:hypothetical protein